MTSQQKPTQKTQDDRYSNLRPKPKPGGDSVRAPAVRPLAGTLEKNPESPPVNPSQYPERHPNEIPASEPNEVPVVRDIPQKEAPR